MGGVKKENGWEKRANAITAAMLGVEPTADVGLAGGWPQAWHEAITAGLEAAVVGRIARVTGWTPEDVCEVAALPARRTSGMGHLDPLESERVCRLAWGAAAALLALDSTGLGRDWFPLWSEQAFDTLGGFTPRQAMSTLPGCLWLREALQTWLPSTPR